MRQQYVNFILTFTTGDEKTCDAVSEILIDKIPQINEVEYKSVQKNSTNGDYQFHLGVMTVTIPLEEVLVAMMQLDFIKSGFASPMIPSQCNDITLVVQREETDDSSLITNQLLYYLTNKSQEQQRTIGELQEQIVELNSTIDKFESKFEIMDQRYASFNAYIHSYLNLTTMAKIVYDLVEIVEPSLADKYEQIVTLQ